MAIGKRSVLLAGVALAPLFVVISGARWSDRFLARRYLAKTIPHDRSATTFIRPDVPMTKGLFAHEFIHGFSALGLGSRTVPVAAAAEYCLDYPKGLVADRQISRLVDETLRQQRRLRVSTDRRSYEAHVAAAVDQILTTYRLQKETLVSYLDAARLAGLAMSIADDEGKQLRFLGHLTRGAGGRMAIKALSDPQYEAWLDSTMNNIHHEVAERTVSVRQTPS